mmetsp:Transcript_7044/g.23084  ORF Transcript_7044/g.23084 Transcript_7044/m.23084 type:complete len:197 (+) Transcript_7044:3-593(+)
MMVVMKVFLLLVGVACAFAPPGGAGAGAGGRVPPLTATTESVVSEIATGVSVVAVGGVVMAGAYKLIADAYDGERGLGAFLSDGRGFQRSGYKEGAEPLRAPPKFLDRLRFPNLDFVQVYSSGEEGALEEAEALRTQLRAAIDDGDAPKVRSLEARLEKLMKDNGLAFDADDGTISPKEDLQDDEPDDDEPSSERP